MTSEFWSAAASGIPRDAAFVARAGKRCRARDAGLVTALQNGRTGAAFYRIQLDK